METSKQAIVVPENRVVADITKAVDKVQSRCYRRRTMFQNTVEEAMHSRLWHEEERIREINERLKQLTKQYNEFLDLQREAETRKKRIKTLFSLVGQQDYNAPAGQEVEHKVAMSILRDSVENLRLTLPLWKAMREYLSHVPEARIAEMEAFFQELKFADGNRQAMESALRRHPRVFKIRREKREKYISLK